MHLRQLIARTREKLLVQRRGERPLADLFPIPLNESSMELHSRLSIKAMDFLDQHLAFQTYTTCVALDFFWLEKVGKRIVAPSVEVLVFTEQVRFTPSSRSLLMEPHLSEISMSEITKAEGATDCKRLSQASKDVEVVLGWDSRENKDERDNVGRSKRMRRDQRGEVWLIFDQIKDEWVDALRVKKRIGLDRGVGSAPVFMPPLPLALHQ